jgi:hypothetical protein
MPFLSFSPPGFDDYAVRHDQADDNGDKADCRDHAVIARHAAAHAIAEFVRQQGDNNRESQCHRTRTDRGSRRLYEKSGHTDNKEDTGQDHFSLGRVGECMRGNPSCSQAGRMYRASGETGARPPLP